jgi:hypothetical protein
MRARFEIEMQHSVFGHAIVEQLTSDEFQQRGFARASRADEHFDDVFPDEWAYAIHVQWSVDH